MTVYNVIITVLLVVLGFLSTYLKTRDNLKKQTGDLINTAESMYNSGDGDMKFTFVVETLYSFVPSPLNLILNKHIIEELVQTTFDEMQNFAIKQLDKVTDKVADKIEEGLDNIK